MIPCPIRVAKRYLLGDLNPPLGRSDSPCDVLRRINDEVQNPKDKNQLVRLVENGKDLSNSQAHIVYDDHREKGVGKLRFKNIDITAHAQYRMDFRGVSVDELRSALYEYQKRIQVDRAQKGWSRLEDYLENDTVSYVSSKKLRVVFQPYLDGRGRNLLDRVTGCKIITVYYEGEPNPRPPREESCGIKKASIGQHIKDIRNIQNPKAEKELFDKAFEFNRTHLNRSHQREFNRFLGVLKQYKALDSKRDLKKWKQVVLQKLDKLQEQSRATRQVQEENHLVSGIVVSYKFVGDLPQEIIREVDRTIEKIARTRGSFEAPRQIIVDLLDDRDLEGYYLRGTSFITVTNHTIKKGNILKSISHEFGHFVYEHLDSKDKKVWEDYIDNNVENYPVQDLLKVLAENNLIQATPYTIMKRLESVEPLLHKKIEGYLQKRNNLFAKNNLDFSFDSLVELRKHRYLSFDQEIVSSYGSKDKEEFFAETFASVVAGGTQSLPPILRSSWETMLTN